jgi:hypothetical protein
MTRLALMFAALLVLAGCGNVAPAPPSASPASEPTAELPLDPGVLGLTCADGLVFHPALLESPGHAETDPDAAAQALRVYLAEIGFGSHPQTGWVRTAQSVDKAQFIAQDPDGDRWFVLAFVTRQGNWRLDDASKCQPEIVPPAGANRAEWRLDPAFPAPAAGDRQIHVLINELACASGQSPEGRVLPPIIASSPAAMTIAILVTSEPGGQDCPSNPDFALTIDLPEPLGGRALLDGGVFPPRDVTKPSSG